MEPSEYWKTNSGLVHITPPNDRFPEIRLNEALKKACKGSVFEFGCGDGRLSGQIVSRKKPNMRNKNERVVCFHGNPRPHTVGWQV